MNAGGRGMRTVVRERGRQESARSRRRRRTRGAVVALLVLIVSAATASQAFVFPLLGTGTLSEPSSWKLAPGAPTNLSGGLTQHYGAVPQAPTAEPIEAEEIKKLNGQEDELCGVMGMSITDAHATMPAGTGSCITAGRPIHTAMHAHARPARRAHRGARLGVLCGTARATRRSLRGKYRIYLEQHQLSQADYSNNTPWPTLPIAKKLHRFRCIRLYATTVT